MPDFIPYRELSVGLEFPPSVYLVDADTVRGYVAATSDTVSQAVLSEADSGPSGVAPLTIAALYNLKASSAIPAPPGGILAKQRYRFIRPVHVGELVTTSLMVKELYTRRGRNYVVIEGRSMDEANSLISEVYSTRIWAK